LLVLLPVLLLRPALLFELEPDALFFEPVDLVGMDTLPFRKAQTFRGLHCSPTPLPILFVPLLFYTNKSDTNAIPQAGLGRPRRPFH
jgi:hypothetical protein